MEYHCKHNYHLNELLLYWSLTKLLLWKYKFSFFHIKFHFLAMCERGPCTHLLDLVTSSLALESQLSSIDVRWSSYQRSLMFQVDVQETSRQDGCTWSNLVSPADVHLRRRWTYNEPKTDVCRTFLYPLGKVYLEPYQTSMM